MPDPPGTQWLQSQTQDKQFDADLSYQSAMKALKLTPQEQYAFKHHLGNLYRGGVKQPSGETSTYLGSSFTFGNRTYMLPMVWDNMILEEKEALQRARAVGLDKWPSYKSVKEAEKRYQQIHKFMQSKRPETPDAPAIHQ